MTMRARGGVAGVGLAAVLAFSTLASWAQEPDPAAKSAVPGSRGVRKGVDPSRRVPYYFGQLALTPEQRESIYKIVGKHQQKIDVLQKQVGDLRAQMITECEAVLTDTQKQLLEARRKATPRGARTAGSPAPEDPKTEGDSGSD